MISTLAQVKARSLALLDDPNSATFTDAVLLPAIGESLDALQDALNLYQIPKSKAVATYTLPVNTASVTPATLGIANMGEVIEIRERRSGSSDRYVTIEEVDNLPQRNAIGQLGQWEWRGDAFYFVGATEAREIQVWYFATIGQPSALDSTSTEVDGALTFLSKYAAGIAGPRKGYSELGAMYMQQAVGSRYNEGVIGGALFRLCQPAVRARQRVPVQQPAYSADRWGKVRFRLPYIAAQAQAGSGNMPHQFSSETGTITGTIDGANDTFYLSFPVATANIYRSGVLMTQPTDVAFSANQIVFQAGQIPQVGDVLTAQGWV